MDTQNSFVLLNQFRISIEIAVRMISDENLFAKVKWKTLFFLTLSIVGICTTSIPICFIYLFIFNLKIRTYMRISTNFPSNSSVLHNYPVNVCLFCFYFSNIFLVPTQYSIRRFDFPRNSSIRLDKIKSKRTCTDFRIVRICSHCSCDTRYMQCNAIWITSIRKGIIVSWIGNREFVIWSTVFFIRMSFV